MFLGNQLIRFASRCHGHQCEIKMRFDDTARIGRSGNAASGSDRRTTIASAEQSPALPRSRARVAKMLFCTGLCWTACTAEAMAQVIVPGINAPPAIPAPSPSIQVPPIPQLGVPPQPTTSPLLQDTFPDRVSACMQMGAAAGLSAGSLDAYVNQCSNGD
jgi:hypothetical protein